MYIPHCLYPFIHWTLGCFHSLAVEDNAAINMGVEMSLRHRMSIPHGERGEEASQLEVSPGTDSLLSKFIAAAVTARHLRQQWFINSHADVSLLSNSSAGLVWCFHGQRGARFLHYFCFLIFSFCLHPLVCLMAQRSC